MNKIIKNKKIISIVFITLVILFIVFVKFFSIKKSFPKTDQKVETNKNIQEEEIIPTIDSSVIISLKRASTGKDMILKIESIPNNTESIEYELSYNTEKQGLQGVIGTIKIKDENNYEKQLTLGTCSSGTCVYHEVLGSIKLNLKFSGTYGERFFEKEFEI